MYHSYFIFQDGRGIDNNIFRGRHSNQVVGCGSKFGQRASQEAPHSHKIINLLILWSVYVNELILISRIKSHTYISNLLNYQCTYVPQIIRLQIPHKTCNKSHESLIKLVFYKLNILQESLVVYFFESQILLFLFVCVNFQKLSKLFSKSFL